jgi:hypothetical protein
MGREPESGMGFEGRMQKGRMKNAETGKVRAALNRPSQFYPKTN